MEVSNLRKRSLAILLCILVLILGVTGTASAADKSSAKMLSITGDVQVIRAGGEKPFKAFLNMKLTEGDRIITGKNGVAKLEMDDGLIITLSQNTRIYLSELRDDKGDKQNSISLQSGAIGSSVKKKLANNARFEIKTPTAVMGVRGTEFLVQYYGSHLDLRVIEGIIETRINVGRNGEITGLGAADASSQYVQLRALEQISFSEGDIASTIPTTIRPFSIEGLPVPLLDRLAEIHKESPDSIPTEIMSGLDNARQEAINQLQKINNDSDLANDDLSFKTPSPSTTITETASPSHVATTASTASGSGGSSSSSGGSSSTKPKAEFRVHYGNDEILNNATITCPYTAGQTGVISLGLIPVKEELYDEISYEVSSSASSVASASADENQIYVNIEAVGETILTIKGKADGYQDYVKTVKLVVVDNSQQANADFTVSCYTTKFPDKLDIWKEIGEKTIKLSIDPNLENISLQLISDDDTIATVKQDDLDNPSSSWTITIVSEEAGEVGIKASVSIEDNVVFEKSISSNIIDEVTSGEEYFPVGKVEESPPGEFGLFTNNASSLALVLTSDVVDIGYTVTMVKTDYEWNETGTSESLSTTGSGQKQIANIGINESGYAIIKITSSAAGHNEVEQEIKLSIGTY